MRWFATALLLVLMFLPSMAASQEYVRYRLPAGHRCTVAAETYQCFNLGEYVELLHLDDDLRHLTEVHVADVARVEALTTASTELQLALDTANSSLTVLEAERVRLEALWAEENRLRNEAENRPDWSWIPWTLAGGFAIATLVLGLVVGVN